MKEKVTYENYAATKMIIYKYYSDIKTMNDVQRKELFSNFGYLEKVARNTFLCPYDIELYNDIKTISQHELFNSRLQEKYNISSRLLNEKYQEYYGYEFERLLYEDEYIDYKLVEQFHLIDKKTSKNI